MIRALCLGAAGLALLTACQRLEQVGRLPEFTPTVTDSEYLAMTHPGLPPVLDRSRTPESGASLWSRARGSLLGERRAAQRGDILTVVIEIDDRAEMSNTSDRSRTSGETMQVPEFLSLPQRIDPGLPDGAAMATAVDTSGSSSFSGDGSVRRNEKLTLRVAATVVDVMHNGVLQIRGTQEVRVNYELRELIVQGFVRPLDISRQNEVTYDKIAGARISYGGRGQISDMQQPRYGQQIADIILPF